MSVFGLIERLAPHVESEVNLVIKSKQEAGTLSSKLKKIQVGLQDAERKGVTDESVKEWLKEVEDVTYEMDDVLDEWETANLRVEVEGFDGNTSNPLEKVRSLVLFLCLCFKQVVGRREITKKIKALSERIDELLRKRGEYTFVSSAKDWPDEFRQEQSTSLVNKFQVYGVDLVKDSLVEKLVSDDMSGSGGTQVIAIVGIGGVGKTTLAQLAYNDGEIDGLFSPKAWVSVSKSFDALTVAREILEGFGETCDDARNLEKLVQQIKKVVYNRRFLLVLDNVWTEDHSKWESLRYCLDGAKGSRILVTTRSESVARMMGSVRLQPLSLLSDSDCGEIINGIALQGRTREECESFRDIGIEIAKKCNGLPLAARSVGSMLALRSAPEWRAVLESPLWMDEDKESDLFRLLNLSYVDLSPLLKRCFLSSTVFHKGALIKIDEMIRIWMAYGYLGPTGRSDQVQLKGLQYFNNLAMRSFFQRADGDDDDDEHVISFKMHDIVHDFANYLSVSDQHRSFIVGGGVDKTNLPWNSLEKLRTFCARNISGKELHLDNLIRQLKSVRILRMNNCELHVLPREVGTLIHLRYLDLSHNPITELPETLSDLCNLQTLCIENCHEIFSLPQSIEKLINLRHLLNSGTHKLVEYPQGLAKLTSLWTLSEFRGTKFGYLRNMNHLQGSLSLYIEGSEECVSEVVKADLKSKKHIDKLVLTLPRDIEEEMVEAELQPPPNLETLVLQSETGKWLSHLIHSTSLNYLKVVEFKGASDLPPFWKLPSLEELEIKSCRFKCMSIEKLLGIEDENGASTRVGCFPRLKKLSFQYCEEWDEWEDIKGEEDYSMFACMEELEIIGSPRLEALPNRLLRRASSLDVLKLSSHILHKRYNKLDGVERHNIPHIRNVKYVYGELITKEEFIYGVNLWFSEAASPSSPL